jgi:hypothetical protein
MTFTRIMVILWFQAGALGACALISYRLGARSAYWKGVARGMHVVQRAAFHVMNGTPMGPDDEFDPGKEAN